LQTICVSICARGITKCHVRLKLLTWNLMATAQSVS
jgi:hypothetical protein